MISTTNLNAQLTLIAAQLGTVRIAAAGNTLEMSWAEAQKLYAWLSSLDTQGKLKAETTFYPAIKNAIDQDGKPLSDTFGMVRVLHSDATQVHEYDHCSDGSLLITNMHTSNAVVLNQVEAVTLLSRLQQGNAGVQL